MCCPQMVRIGRRMAARQKHVNGCYFCTGSGNLSDFNCQFDAASTLKPGNSGPPHSPIAKIGVTERGAR